MEGRTIFAILFFIQYLWDRLTSSCITWIGEALLIVHHLVSIYIFIGGFIFNPKYHLITLMLIIIHWKTNQNRCILTEWTNMYCGHEKDKYFEDLNVKLGLREMNPNIHWYIFALLLFYDIHKINK